MVLLLLFMMTIKNRNTKTKKKHTRTHTEVIFHLKNVAQNRYLFDADNSVIDASKTEAFLGKVIKKKKKKN